jgi:CRISPR system Cascade subunit CasD
MNFLMLRYTGAFAAWGTNRGAGSAVRPTNTSPPKSGHIGGLGAALGLKREDPRLLNLHQHLGFASRVLHHGPVLRDYHTALSVGFSNRFGEVPRKQLRSRREAINLAMQEERSFGLRRLRGEKAGVRLAVSKTNVSNRDYLQDVLYYICVWAKPGLAFTLEEIQEAVVSPTFFVFLGRKSCPLSLPLFPTIVEAEDPVEALCSDPFPALPSSLMSFSGSGVVRWEGDWITAPTPTSTSRVRDVLHNLGPRVFSIREEHALMG